MILKIKQNKLEKVFEVDFKNGKELQRLCESNLELLFNLEFVATELIVENY